MTHPPRQARAETASPGADGDGLAGGGGSAR